MTTRILRSGDEARLNAFLASHADSTMILRGNLHGAGIEDRGGDLEGTYAATFEGKELVGVACHYWNGNLILETPAGGEEAARAAIAASGRRVRGILGRSEQVEEVRRALGLDRVPAARESREGLFSLDLAELVVPDLLVRDDVVVREPRKAELELLVEWRWAFAREALGASGEAARQRCRDEIEMVERLGRHWVLEVAEEVVAYSAFNAALEDSVQVGGVWTPPEQRGRGYARAAVAGTLLLARERGVERSVLFTDNPAAERAYRALGFRQVGEYGMVLFVEPQTPAS